jgi:ubiquinone/menaquinone biosynthesis C-methylase UbiE
MTPDDMPGLDYERLYQYRFRNVNQRSRQAVWDVLAPAIHRWLGSPQRVLDPAAGRGEFVQAISALERWAVDTVEFEETAQDRDVVVVVGDARFVDLPSSYFDGVFVSNLLEHLPSQQDVARFLGHMRGCMTPGGRIAVMGPNFRYCSREYFDCADHTLALTHVSVQEHLYAAGFDIDRVIPRFIPYSFRSRVPHASWLVRAYLAIKPAWRAFGKQFLIVASKPGG